MDMRTKLGIWLTGETVHAMGDRYEGVIAEVAEQMVRNRFTTKTGPVLVVVFTDCKQLVLNRTMQFELMERFGHNSDHWLGETIVVGCRRVERADSKTGQPIVSWQKFLQGDAGLTGTVG